MLPGVKLQEIKKNLDERGFFAELFRTDWKGFIGGDRIMQINLSESKPSIIRAWHRHLRGQIDYIAVIKGTVKVCIYDGGAGSASKGQLEEVVLDSKNPKILRVPGHYWHGTKCIGKEPSTVLYLVTALYDYENPDEERKPFNDCGIIDAKSSEAYDWSK